MFCYLRHEGYIFVAVCVSVCKISKMLRTDFDGTPIFKKECLCARDKSISFWKRSGYRFESCG